MAARSKSFWPNLIVALGVLVFVLALFFASSDDKGADPVSRLTAGTAFVPPMLIPQDNPLTAAKAELGRYLFYDTRLSFNNTIACASCHQQRLAFTDGLALSPGATGDLTRRNAMSLANVGHNSVLTWADSAVTRLEHQARVPLLAEHPLEMGALGHEAEILGRLQQDEQYRQRFGRAFPGDEQPYTLDKVIMALASFQRTLVSYQSPYDQYLAGDAAALNSDALRGRDLFFSSRMKCFRCHGGHNFRFTLGHRKNEKDRSVAYHNTGLYNVDGRGAYPTADQGLIEVSGNARDMGRFKAPTLRNIALTAPYMHDGSIESLEAVIEHYARGGRLLEEGDHTGDGKLNPFKSELVGGFALDTQERSDLLAFLRSLTDENFIGDPDLSDPWQSPDLSGLEN